MMKFVTIVFLAFLLTAKSNAQNIDSLELSSNEIPGGYSLTEENNCISIQACIFYDKPDIYGALIGNLKSKRIQNFNNKKDRGSIMYFEFENDFKGEDFLGALLWGGDKPTREHPEEIYAKGNFLIIWSFKKGSVVTAASKNKIKTVLK
jgi:hypothetical protein